jgi:pyruvyltransferase
MSKINAYWYSSHISSDVSNWGDAINPWLISKFSDSKVTKNEKMPRLFAIGSVLQHGVKDNDIIWGTGTLSSKRITPNLDLDIRAVRGPLTRDVLLKSGYKCPDVYGDPAMLVKDFYNHTVEVTHDFGIIPHVSELEHPIILDILKRYNVKLINIRLGHTEFIDELKSVSYVISSSLHGLIMADAYGIPNTKIDLPGTQWKGSNWKFADYFASVERPFAFGHTLTEGVDLNWLIKNSHFNQSINIDLDPLRNAIDWDKLKID